LLRCFFHVAICLAEERERWWGFLEPFTVDREVGSVEWKKEEGRSEEISEVSE
jgi:hypothetical protein